MNRAQVTIALAGLAVGLGVGALVGWAVIRRSDTEKTSEACVDRSYGHISKLERADDHYVLRFDPAWLTTGVTANTAAAEDGVIEPGDAVPNDNYRIDEGHRLLTYLVPTDTPVTVLTRGGEGPLGETPITVGELSALLDGETPVELFEGLDTGVWIQLDGDTVCRIDQQYVP